MPQKNRVQGKLGTGLYLMDESILVEFLDIDFTRNVE